MQKYQQRRKIDYLVSGPGTFPDDMLRYDQAVILGTTQLLGKTAYLINGLCTRGRWNSFLWVVFEARRHFPAGDSERGPVNWQACIQGKWLPVQIRRVS